MYPNDRADLTVAEIVKACANALSWVRPLLADAQVRDFVGTIADRGGRLIYEDAERGCWWADALNSNWAAVLNSGLGFAALAWRCLDREEAADWLARARDVVGRMLDLAAEEGAGVEGPGYWLYCFGSIQDLVAVLRNVAGDDLYKHPFWHRCSRFLPYLTLPDMSGWVPYADTGPGPLHGSAFFHGVASWAQDPLAQWFGNEIIRRHGGVTWKNLLYYDAAIPEQPIAGEPPCRFFRSIHLASFRSGWDRDAVLLVFKGGSNAWSHTHLDLNSFFIAAYGERLATDPGPEPYSVDLWHSVQPAVSTAWHNCIVVDGAHQRMAPQYAMSYDLQEAGDCYSRLGDHLSSNGVEMIRGDATTAYGDTLDRAWRDIVYLRPDVFVVFDDLRGRPARVQRNFEWLLHSEHPMRETDHGVEACGERGRLLIQPVFPRGWEHKYVEGKTAPRSDEQPLYCVSIRPYWHHKWNVNPRRSPYPHWHPRGDPEPLYADDCQFLVVLCALRREAPPRFEVEGFDRGTAKGVRLNSEDERCVVLFNPGGELVDVVELRTDAEKAVLRERGGEVCWAVLRGTGLIWNGELLFESAERTSRAGP